MPLYQERYGWRTVMTAVHFLPTGVFSGTIATVSSTFVTMLNQAVNPRRPCVCLHCQHGSSVRRRICEVLELYLPCIHCRHPWQYDSLHQRQYCYIYEVRNEVSSLRNVLMALVSSCGISRNSGRRATWNSPWTRMLTSVQESVDNKRAAQGYLSRY